jgi:hypothetical protein
MYGGHSFWYVPSGTPGYVPTDAGGWDWGKH